MLIVLNNISDPTSFYVVPSPTIISSMCNSVRGIQWHQTRAMKWKRGWEWRCDPVFNPFQPTFLVVFEDLFSVSQHPPSTPKVSFCSSCWAECYRDIGENNKQQRKLLIVKTPNTQQRSPETSTRIMTAFVDVLHHYWYWEKHCRTWEEDARYDLTIHSSIITPQQRRLTTLHNPITSNIQNSSIFSSTHLSNQPHAIQHKNNCTFLHIIITLHLVELIFIQEMCRIQSGLKHPSTTVTREHIQGH